MKRIIIFAGLGVVAVLGVLMAAPNFIDWTKHREQILSRLHEETGYEYALGGDLRMAILPYPHAILEKLSIRVHDKPLASFDKASVSVALWPLLQGRVVVSSVILVKPEVTLEKAADGTESWMTPELQAKLNQKPDSAQNCVTGQVCPSALEGIVLNDITVREGAFSYLDRSTNKSYKIDKLSVSVRGDTLFGPYTLNGELAYAGQPIRFSGKTGRIERNADSLPVQMDVDVPDSGSTLSFSGVAAFRNSAGVQGETEFKTADLKSLLALAGSDVPALEGKKAGARGILTASANEIAYKNLKMSFAGSEADGSLVIKSAKEGRPLDVSVTLHADKPVDLNSVLPARKPADGDKAKVFLPESLTLPAELVAALDFSAPAVQYSGITLSNVKMTGSHAGSKMRGKLAADLPGAGSFSSTFDLSYNAASRSPSTGAVTLSDPTLSYTLTAKSGGLLKTVQAFLAAKSAEGLGVLLQGPTSLDIAGSVKPTRLGADRADVSLGGSSFSLGGSAYDLGKSGGRDHVTLAMTADKLDADEWIRRLSPPQKLPAGVTSEKMDIRQMAEKTSLPVNLDLVLALKNVRFKESDYDNVKVMATLLERKMDIKTFEARDKNGNYILASGSVGDRQKLKDVNVSMQGKTSDLRKFLDGFDVDTARLPVAAAGGAEMLSEFKGNSDKLSFTANLKAMNGSLDTSGVLTGVLAQPTVSALTLRLKHPNYVDVIRLFSPEFKSGVAIRKSMDIFANVKQEGNIYTLSNLQGTLGPASLSGEVKFDKGSSVPGISGKLQMGDVPLDDLIGHDAGAEGGGAKGVTRQGQDVRWSRNAINTEWMRKFSLDLNATARSISYGPWLINDATLVVTLENGVLNLSRLDGRMYGGQAMLKGKATSAAAARQPLTVEGNADLKDISLESFVQSFSGARLVTARGSISMNTSIAATGLSPAALVFDLNGAGKANGSDIVFQGFDLARLSRTMVQPPSGNIKDNLAGFVGSAMQGGSTAFDKLTSSFTITEGVINLDELTLTGKAATVTSPGKINLPLWSIDMESTIKLTEPADAPPLKVTFRGPLDRPGQTFAGGALNNYIDNIVGSKVQGILQKKLKGNDALQNLLGIPAPAPAAGNPAPAGQAVTPAPSAAPAPVAAPAPSAAPATSPPAEQTPPPSQEVKPEDIFRGVLEGVMQGQ